MPTEWNLNYPSWMIADGEPDREVGETFEWFAVEFWTQQPLTRAGVRSKTAVLIADFNYRITGEITYLSEKACVIDFGLSAIDTPDAVAPDCRQGDYVTGDIGIGLPLCVEMAPEAVLETLRRKWHVNSISADLTPFKSHPDNPRILVRDEARTEYIEAKSTRDVNAHDYVLRCNEIR
jgi:hypothetical protein